MKAPKFLPGDFYAKYDQELKAYKLYRILIAEPTYGGIHVSLYSNLFPELPKRINTDELHFGIMNISMEGDQATVNFNIEPDNSLTGMLKDLADEKKHFGIMHFPLSIEGFNSEALHYVYHAPLEDKDLEGFRTYLIETGFPEEEQEGYIQHILHRSSDRDQLVINKWLKWIVPLLTLLLMAALFRGWFPRIIPIVVLVLLAGISWHWWGRFMPGLKQLYEDHPK